MKNLEEILEGMFDDDFGVDAVSTLKLTMASIMRKAADYESQNITYEEFEMLWDSLDDKKITRDFKLKKMNQNSFLSHTHGEIDLMALSMNGDTPKYSIIATYNKGSQRVIIILTNDGKYPRACHRDISMDHFCLKIIEDSKKFDVDFATFGFSIGLVQLNGISNFKIFAMREKEMTDIIKHMQ